MDDEALHAVKSDVYFDEMVAAAVPYNPSIVSTAIPLNGSSRVTSSLKAAMLASSLVLKAFNAWMTSVTMRHIHLIFLGILPSIARNKEAKR